MATLGDRIVVLIDMDCFFCQVEAKLNPELKGKPLAVIQYGSFGPSSIIAVNYEARAFGVTRHMRGPEAKEKCQDIVLVTVPPLRNKPDTGRYRVAGRDVIQVLKKYCPVIERASIDEAYLDITELVEERVNSMTTKQENIVEALSNTFVVGYCDDESNDEESRREGVERWVAEAFEDLGDVQARKLAIAGMLVEEFRAEIWSQCEYRCSAGISYNKILAKLACGLHKPNRQTILPAAAVPGLYSSLPVKKVRNLGGKFGNIVMESLGCNVMADLYKYSLQDLQKRFDEKTGSWLYNIARGIDNEVVTNRLVCKSIGSSKNFPGKAAITKLEVLKHWVSDLCDEIVDRLEQDMEENERRATHLTISYSYYQDKKVVTQSKSCPLTSYKSERIAKLCVDVITRATQKPVAFIGMSAGKFVPVKGSGNFINFFKSTTKTEESQVKVLKEESKSVDSTEESPEAKNCPEKKLEDSLELDTKVDEPKIKTYSRKSVDIKVEPMNNFSNLFTTKEKIPEAKISLPEVTDKKPNFLLDADITKKFDGEHFKNSFFMNILKDSTSLLSSDAGSSADSNMKKKPSKIELLESNTSHKYDNASPDLFDDSDSPENADGEDNGIQDNGRMSEEKSVEVEEKRESNALAKLKEIFPDLDNIDPSVVQLLPIELQREANAYLKSTKPPSTSSSNKNNIKTTAKPKSTKTKSTAKTSNNKNGVIQNFFVTNSASTSDSPMKRCTECNQMIILTKFQEHCDFHVAQNLQRIINQAPNNDSQNSAMRKSVSPELESLNVKRKQSIETPRPSKKPRGIESFFS